MERVHIEFNQFEMALKKRMAQIIETIEEEVMCVCVFECLYSRTSLS